MNDLRDRLQAALKDALKRRDQSAIRAVRSALSAIANAEAVDAGAVPTQPPPAADPAVAGTVAGVGAAEVARRDLSDDDLKSIVTGEISDRRAAAETYEESGRTEPADRLRQEADLLEGILLGPASS